VIAGRKTRTDRPGSISSRPSSSALDIISAERPRHRRSQREDDVSDTSSDLREAVASHLWYHTMELRPGVVTPGWFDLRPIVDGLPWPDVAGKRCLDVGTYDGFLAFELERRGAAEIVAIDIDDHDQWDWPPDVRATGGENLAKLAGPEKGRGFRIASQALGSKVDRRPVSVYDLAPGLMGRFDVVVCGSLLLHLRDPLRALEAIRTVCAGWFMSSEQIDLWMSVVHRRTPVHVLNGSGPLCQWFVPNAAGHRRTIFAAGFGIVRETRPFAVPHGSGHPSLPRTPRHAARAALQRAVCGRTGVPHAAVLARPRV
jgi:tRNA (mo5U34)-methyltransferase